MSKLLVRRVLLTIPTLIVLTIALLAWVHALPGSPVDALLGDRATPAQRAQVMHLYGLDRSIWVQYVDWCGRLLHLDLGTSLQTGAPVLTEFTNRMPADVELAASAMLFGIVLGIPVGYRSASREGGMFDSTAMSVSLLGLAVPVFFLAFLLKYLFAVKWHLLPSDGRQDPLIAGPHPTGFYVLDGLITGNGPAAWDAIQHLILPAIAAGAIPFAVISRITRTSVRSVLDSDHVKFAKAAGLSVMRVHLRHVLRNALIPIVTSVGLLTALLLTGAVLTETVFGISGVGQFLYSAINARDYPTIQGLTLMIGVMYMVLNILVDLSYGLIDPRVRTS